MQRIIQSTADNKAAGIRWLIVEIIKNGGNYLIQWITKQFNFWIQSKHVRACILRNQIRLIPKGVFDGNIKNTRPINLIEVFRK